MASAFTKSPILRNVAIRGYSAQAAPIAGTTSYDVKTTTLPNKIIVASADNNSAISRISIVFRAGARNETPDNQGVTHVLRAIAGTTTRSWSQFAIARRVAQKGASLSCTTDRELITYTLEGTSAAVEDCVPFLTAMATEQVFFPWEISEQERRIRVELANRPPQLRAIDLLHKAAFRRGLGNSLYIAKYNIGKVESETLQHYVAQNFAANRTAVVGMGVNHAQLEHIAQSLQLESGSDKIGPGDYKGGEIRSDKGGDMAYVAVAGEGGAFANQKEALAFAILQKALGTGPAISWGNESGSLIRKAVGEVNGPHSLSAINVSYTDTGLFGVMIGAKYDVVNKIVPIVVKLLKSGDISAKDINRGKNQLVTDILSLNSSQSVERLSRETAITGNPMSPCALAEAVLDVADSAVQAAAKKVTCQPLTIAAVGNLRNVPFRDEL